MATKSLITFNTRCHSIAGAVPDEWFLQSRLGEAVAQEAQPVCQCPGISRKQKTQALSSVSVPAPTQKRRKSQAQESQVIQVPQSPDSLEDPELPRKVATKISWCIVFTKLVRCASPGQVNQKFAMADGFDNRCLSCSELRREAFGRLSLKDFPAHANTRAGVEDLAQYENTKAGTEPDWIPEDVLAETSTRVCVERSVLVLTAAEYRKESLEAAPWNGGAQTTNNDTAERTEPRRE